MNAHQRRQARRHPRIRIRWVGRPLRPGESPFLFDNVTRTTERTFRARLVPTSIGDGPVSAAHRG